MTKAANVHSIEKATGRSWESWVGFLDAMKARKMPHAEIAKAVYPELKLENAGWWAQGITVAYEQHIGRRAPGQSNDGGFEVSVSRTFSGRREEIYQNLLGVVNKKSTFNDLQVTAARTSITPVRSYWRCNSSDGSQVVMAAEQRNETKALLTITQTKMKTSDQAEKARSFWKAFLDTI